MKICELTAGIKEHKSIIKKKRKNYDNIVLWAKPNVNVIEILISIALAELNINHEEFVSVNSLLRKCDEMMRRNKKS